MKQLKIVFLGIAAMAGVLIPASDANAWVAAAGGYRGGAVAFGGYHPVYHPGFYGGGCYGCGAAAGAVAGMAVGAAIANNARPPTVVVQQAAPVYVQQPVYAARAICRSAPRWRLCRPAPAAWLSMARSIINTGRPGTSRFTARAASITRWCRRPNRFRSNPSCKRQQARMKGKLSHRTDHPRLASRSRVAGPFAFREKRMKRTVGYRRAAASETGNGEDKRSSIFRNYGLRNSFRPSLMRDTNEKNGDLETVRPNA